VDARARTHTHAHTNVAKHIPASSVLIATRGSGPEERLSSPSAASGSGRSPAAKRILVHFRHNLHLPKCVNDAVCSPLK